MIHSLLPNPIKEIQISAFFSDSGTPRTKAKDQLSDCINFFIKYRRHKS